MIKYHLDYGIAKELMQSTLGKDDAYYLTDFGSLILIQIIPKEHTKYQTLILFLFKCKKLAIVFHYEHVEMKETSEKLLKIIITLSGTQLVLKQ